MITTEEKLNKRIENILRLYKESLLERDRLEEENSRLREEKKRLKEKEKGEK